MTLFTYEISESIKIKQNHSDKIQQEEKETHSGSTTYIENDCKGSGPSNRYILLAPEIVNDQSGTYPRLQFTAPADGFVAVVTSGGTSNSLWELQVCNEDDPDDKLLANTQRDSGSSMGNYVMISKDQIFRLMSNSNNKLNLGLAKFVYSKEAAKSIKEEN